MNVVQWGRLPSNPSSGLFGVDIPGVPRPGAPVPQTRNSHPNAAAALGAPALGAAKHVADICFHWHGAQTRFGLRGGGRLRVLSTDAVAPPSLFAHRRSRPATRTVALQRATWVRRDGNTGLLK